MNKIDDLEENLKMKMSKNKTTSKFIGPKILDDTKNEKEADDHKCEDSQKVRMTPQMKTNTK